MADPNRWKTVPEVGAGNRKSPFADGREIGRWYCKLVGVSRPPSSYLFIKANKH